METQPTIWIVALLGAAASFQSDIGQDATCESWRPEMSHISDSDWFNTVALEQSWTSELDIGSVRSRKALCLICAAWCSAAAALCKYRGQSHSPPTPLCSLHTGFGVVDGWPPSTFQITAVGAKLADSTLSQ